MRACDLMRVHMHVYVCTCACMCAYTLERAFILHHMDVVLLSLHNCSGSRLHSLQGSLSRSNKKDAKVSFSC